MPKRLVTHYYQLDILRLAREDDLTQFTTFFTGWEADATDRPIRVKVVPGEGLWLDYPYQKEWVRSYQVQVAYTRPRYGGQRPWFICPGGRCGRRVRILYGGRYFLCRHCYDLTYATQQESKRRAVTAAVSNQLQAIQRRLGGSGGPMAALPDKPQGMHWSTYVRLVEKHDALQTRRSLCLGDWYRARMAAWLGEAAEVALQQDPLAADPTPPLSFAQWLAQRATAPAATNRAPAGEEAQDNRLTLGQLAKRAGVPYAFAKEAVREELLKPDQGRTTRRKRYRRKLASWLAKLHQLYGAGTSWAELQAWSQRRWLPGHKDERQWPCDASAEGRGE